MRDEDVEALGEELRAVGRAGLDLCATGPPTTGTSTGRISRPRRIAAGSTKAPSRAAYARSSQHLIGGGVAAPSSTASAPSRWAPTSWASVAAASSSRASRGEHADRVHEGVRE